MVTIKISDPETRYVCPECGWTESFYVSWAMANNFSARFVNGSWEFSLDEAKVYPDNDDAEVTCGNPECGMTGPPQLRSLAAGGPPSTGSRRKGHGMTDNGETGYRCPECGISALTTAS